MDYRVIGFEWIGRERLEAHPDAAAYPSESDDRAVVAASIDEVGVLQPLTVQLKDDGGNYWVLDGIGRLEGSTREALPCLLVECSDPRRLALTINSAGRKRSTGSRVLCYLMANRAQVMEAAQWGDLAVNSSLKRGGVSRDTPPPIKGTGNDKMPAEVREWTVGAIARRLGVSNKDVAMALELMRCHEGGVYPRIVGREQLAGTEIADPDHRESMAVAFGAVMAGSISVRRWQSAFSGRALTVGKEKSETNYGLHGEAVMKSLGNVMRRWKEVDMGLRERVLNAFWDAMQDAPDDVRETMNQLLNNPKSKLCRK